MPRPGTTVMIGADPSLRDERLERLGRRSRGDVVRRGLVRRVEEQRERAGVDDLVGRHRPADDGCLAGAVWRYPAARGAGS